MIHEVAPVDLMLKKYKRIVNFLNFKIDFLKNQAIKRKNVVLFNLFFHVELPVMPKDTLVCIHTYLASIDKLLSI